MAKQTTKTGEAPVEDDILANFSSDTPDLDGGIDGLVDSLRSVAKNDAEGGLPDLGDGGGFDFDAGGGGMGDADLSQFGGGFGGGMDAGFGGGSSAASHTTGSALHANLDLIMDIPIDVQIVLGSSHMHVATLMNLTEGATIALDRKIGDPVEVVVNGRQIGRGEITVLDEDNTRFGIRMIEVKAIKR